MQSKALISDLNQIDQLITQSAYLFSSTLIIQLLAGLLLSIGIILIFIYSKRPGRIMMFGGLLFYILFTAPFFYFELLDGQDISANLRILIMYLPLAASVSLGVIAVGLLKLAWSFRMRD